MEDIKDIKSYDQFKNWLKIYSDRTNTRWVYYKHHSGKGWTRWMYNCQHSSKHRVKPELGLTKRGTSKVCSCNATIAFRLWNNASEVCNTVLLSNCSTMQHI